MIIKYKQLNKIDLIVASIYAKNPAVQNTKFGYAYKRFAEKYLYPKQKEYYTELSEISIDNALIDDKTKEILFSEDSKRGFKYSKDGLKAVIKAEAELNDVWEEKDIEVEPYFVNNKDLPKLNEYEEEHLKGLFIK